MATEAEIEFAVECDESTGQVRSGKLYGQELLDPDSPCQSDLWVNGQPLTLRPHIDHNRPSQPHLKDERWGDHLAGWSLV